MNPLESSISLSNRSFILQDNREDREMLDSRRPN